jgi:GT2 family glycosyltransferase
MIIAVAPLISVVTPTHNRPDGLARLVASLQRQELDPDQFEVIVVDDGSRVLQDVETSGMSLRVVRHEVPRGPAAARNTGWRTARAPVVAFIDDDCTAQPGWLTSLLAACPPSPADRFVIQGRVEPEPLQSHELTPLSHTIQVPAYSPVFLSANIAYSRALLEETGGFDEGFKHACGEDIELGARSLVAGASALFAPDALVHHEVRQLTLKQHLRHTWKWTAAVRALSLQPQLRELLVAKVFWKTTHPLLVLALAGLLSRRRAVALTAFLPYLAHYRRRYGRIGLPLVTALPAHVTIDAAEIFTAIAGSLQYRTLML